MAPTTIVWFRRDLRLEDNPALVSAVRGGSVIPVFIWAPEEEGQFLPGRVSRWWLKQSLIHLQQSLVSLGASLILRRAPDALSVLLQIAKDSGASQVFYNHLYDPVSLVRDHRVKQGLVSAGIAVSTFNADLLYEPWEINDDHGSPFTTFSDFWWKCMEMPIEPEASLLPPKRIMKYAGPIFSSSVEDLGLEDELEKGSNDLLARAWSPGWANADKALETFVSGPLMEYASNRQKVDRATTSLLSPHLHYGELSVRKVFRCVSMKQVLWVKEGNKEGEHSVNLFLRSIGFREYSRYLSFNFPFTHERPLLSNLRHFPWRVDEGYFKIWRQGRTGYPLVDAGMRELWATGWLHNRVRVIVSSFFVKFLQLPWRWGMKYFWDTLLDADLECDVLGWQYISGSLPDGHELDRIDNPQMEGYKYDPHGEYVRRWLPELSRLPSEWIHHPWDAPSNVLRAAGIELGVNYPRPIIEEVSARQRLQQALSVMWEQEAVEQSAVEARQGSLRGTAELQGMDAEMENMEMDRSVNHGAGSNVLDRRNARDESPYDQMVPNVSSEPARTIVAAQSSSYNMAERWSIHRVYENGDRLVYVHERSANGNDDTNSTAESSSAQRNYHGGGNADYSAGVRYNISSPSIMRHDDSQVPLVPEVHQGVLSGRHGHPSMVNFEAIGASKTSSLSA